MDRKAQFNKIYANLPLGMREEIIVVIDDEPLTWNSAGLEVEQDTYAGYEILQALDRLKLLF